MSRFSNHIRADLLRQLFDEAVKLDPGDRAGFLDRACAGQEELRRELQSLLDIEDEATSYFSLLEQTLIPALGAAAGTEDDTSDSGSRSSYTSPLDPLLGRQVSHFRIEEVLGRGGMGVVYRATDTRLGRSVALKFLPAELTVDTASMQRFLQEARAASALDHPNIGSVYDIDETADGRPFIAMALYSGDSLKQEIARGPVSPDTAVNIAKQLAEGLSAAHEQGIVHRDVKPGNVIVAPDGSVKLVDFGVAKMEGGTITRKGERFGTVAYMSPEQIRGEAVDHRTDIWSLGVVLYEILNGKRPFRGGHDQAMIHAILNDDPEPCQNSVSPAVRNAIRKALEKNVDDRYQSMANFRSDLESSRTGLAALHSRSGSRAGWRLGLWLTMAVVAVSLLATWFLRSRPVETWEPAIGVLPIRYLSDDPDDEYIGAGMTEALVTNLARIDGLTVRPAQSAVRFKDSNLPSTEIADALRVDFLLSGSMLQSAHRVRVDVQIVEGSTDRLVWSEEYEQEASDILALQSSIAQAVAAAVEVTLTPEDERRLGFAQSVDPAAYDAYVRGQYIFVHHPGHMAERILEALPYVERSIEIDTTFAQAYAWLSGKHLLLGYFGTRRLAEVAPLARQYNERALAIDSTLPSAWVSHSLLLKMDWDLAGAEHALLRAVEVDPSGLYAQNELAWFNVSVRRFDDAIVQARHVLSRQPRSFYTYLILAGAYLGKREFPEAVEWSRRAVHEVPQQAEARIRLGTAYFLAGQHEEAIEQFHEVVRLDSGRVGLLGYALAATGSVEQAIEILEGLPENSFERLFIFMGLGEHERALDLIEEHWLVFFGRINRNPIFDPLREYPRFQTWSSRYVAG